MLSFWAPNEVVEVENLYDDSSRHGVFTNLRNSTLHHDKDVGKNERASYSSSQQRLDRNARRLARSEDARPETRRQLWSCKTIVSKREGICLTEPTVASLRTRDKGHRTGLLTIGIGGLPEMRRAEAFGAPLPVRVSGLTTEETLGNVCAKCSCLLFSSVRT